MHNARCRWLLAAGTWLLAWILGSFERVYAVTAEEIPSEQPILALDAGGHTGWVSKVLVSAYDDQLISVGFDKTIRFWDLHTGEPTRALRPPIGPGFQGRLYAAALSPDCKLLAVGGDSALLPVNDHRVILIDLPEGQIVKMLAGHTGPIRDLAFSPDGMRLASCSDDRTLRIWDVASGQSQRTLVGHAKRVYGVTWSPDGSKLVSGSWDNTARIWLADTGATLAVLAGHTADVLKVAWSPDGRTIATAGGDRSVRLWEPNGQFRHGFFNLNNHVSFVEFSRDSKQLICGWGSRKSLPHGTAVFDLTRNVEQARFLGHLDTPMTGVFLKDGEQVATAGPPGDIYIWNTRDGSLVRRMGSRGSFVPAVGWSLDNRTIAWGNHKDVGSVIKSTTPLEHTFHLPSLTLGSRSAEIFHRAQSEWGNLSIARHTDYVATVRQNGAPLTSLSIFNPDDMIRCRTLLPDGRAVLGCSYGVFVYNALNGQPIYTLPGHTGTIWALAPSADGRYLLTGSADQTMELWNLQTYEHLLSVFVGGDEWVAWTPQGYYACSPAGEGLMGWHMNRGPFHMADFYPAARFRASLYRPDVIRQVIEAGSPLRALTLADADRNVASEPLVVSAALPPQVSITAPTSSRQTLESDQLTITATAQPSGKDPVTAMMLLVDGRPVEVKSFAENRPMPRSASDKAPEVTQSWQVTVAPGNHQYAVKADTAKSYEVSDPVEVSFAPEKAQKPRLFVLSIGVSAYTQPELRLPHAADDARAVATALAQHGRPLFREVLTHVLADGEATQGSIQEGFRWLTQYMTASDVGVIFLASQSVSDSQGSLHLLASDSQPGARNGGGISKTQLREFVRKTPGKLMLWLDASQADVATRGATLARGSTDDLLRDLLTENYGVIVMGAVTGREHSVQQDGWQHAAFAQALIDGLGGAADADHDGKVHLIELNTYVNDRVKKLTDNRQHPVVGLPAMMRSFPLAQPNGPEAQ